MLTTHYLYFLTSHLLSDLHSLAPAPTAPLYVFTKFSTYLLITKPKRYSESLSHFPYCSIDTVDHYSSLIPLLCYHLLVFLLSLCFLLPGSVLYVLPSSRLPSSALLCLINATDFNYSFCSSDSKFLSSPGHSSGLSPQLPTEHLDVGNPETPQTPHF